MNFSQLFHFFSIFVNFFFSILSTFFRHFEDSRWWNKPGFIDIWIWSALVGYHLFLYFNVSEVHKFIELRFFVSDIACALHLFTCLTVLLNRRSVGGNINCQTQTYQIFNQAKVRFLVYSTEVTNKLSWAKPRRI